MPPVLSTLSNFCKVGCIIELDGCHIGREFFIKELAAAFMQENTVRRYTFECPEFPSDCPLTKEECLHFAKTIAGTKLDTRPGDLPHSEIPLTLQKIYDDCLACGYPIIAIKKDAPSEERVFLWDYGNDVIPYLSLDKFLCPSFENLMANAPAEEIVKLAELRCSLHAYKKPPVTCYNGTPVCCVSRTYLLRSWYLNELRTMLIWSKLSGEEGDKYWNENSSRDEPDSK